MHMYAGIQTFFQALCAAYFAAFDYQCMAYNQPIQLYESVGVNAVCSLWFANLVQTRTGDLYCCSGLCPSDLLLCGAYCRPAAADRATVIETWYSALAPCTPPEPSYCAQVVVQQAKAGIRVIARGLHPQTIYESSCSLSYCT